MNNFDLKDRVAIVTGGAQGFGFAITERFIKSGAKVIIWDIDKKAADEAIKKFLDSKNIQYERLTRDILLKTTAQLIADGKPFDLHAGLLGLAANIVVFVLLSVLIPSSRQDLSRNSEFVEG